jgi:hypothetical protein
MAESIPRIPIASISSIKVKPRWSEMAELNFLNIMEYSSKRKSTSCLGAPDAAKIYSKQANLKPMGINCPRLHGTVELAI